MRRRALFAGCTALALCGPRALLGYREAQAARYAAAQIRWLCRGMIMWAESVREFARFEYVRGHEFASDMAACLAKAGVCAAKAQGRIARYAGDERWLLC